jgi:hypothetical protein
LAGRVNYRMITLCSLAPRARFAIERREGWRETRADISAVIRVVKRTLIAAESDITWPCVNAMDERPSFKVHQEFQASYLPSRPLDYRFDDRQIAVLSTCAVRFALGANRQRILATTHVCRLLCPSR